jgi:hypothetical protein
MKGKGRPLLELGFLLVLLLVLNTLLSTFRYFPEYEWRFLFFPLPETVALGFLLWGGTRFLTGKTRKIFLLILALFFLFLIVSSLLEAFFLHVYKRPFRVFPNLPLASHFFNMLFTTDVFVNKTILFLPILILFFLLAFCIYIGFSKSSGMLKNIHLPLGIPVFFVLLFISLFSGPAPSLLERAVSQWRPPEKKDIKTAYELAIPKRAAGTPSVEPEGTLRRPLLPGIKNRNIHLFIVESYGMTVYENPHHFGRIEDFLLSQQRLLKEEGYSVVSYAYESTAFGGTSWLADASLLSGIEIDNQEKYDRIVEEGRRNILHLLEERGYYTILSAPGTTFMTPKYMKFYQYHRYVIEKDFIYQGPYFAYGAMPDQYQLHQVFTGVLDELPSEKRPYFAQYILCSSHTPWHYIPPYVESWSGFDKGNLYNDRSNNTWYENSWVLGSELFEGYIHSIRYSLESVFGYARKFLGEDDLLIVTGDHQPKFPVSEKGASFAVPLHIIGKDRELLVPFTGLGYGFHVIPPKEQNYPGLEDFAGQFISLATSEKLVPRPTSAPLSIPR